jgi:hypothetical protein
MLGANPSDTSKHDTERMVDEPQVRPDVRVPAPHRLTAAERRRPCRADLSGSADPHEA